MFVADMLLGKVAILTGGGSGITLTIAERLVNLGARVTLIGRTPDKLEAAVAAIRERGGEADFEACDVRDFETLATRYRAIHEQHGAIDVLVNGAAGNFVASAAEMTSNGFKAVMDIDALGTFHSVRAAYPYLRKPGAVLINISAIQAFAPGANQIHVNAAKAAVDQITRTTAIEWGPVGIRSVSIAPGPVGDTEGMARLAPGSALDAMVAAIPLRRMAQRSEIADLTAFLVSPMAVNITGTVVVTDGGQSLVGYAVPPANAS